MTLPSSGTISFGDLQTEFGGSHPITMHEYAPGYLGIGSGVEVSLDDFYGLYRRPLFQGRLSTATDGTAYCRVDNGYVSTTVANTNTNNSPVSVSLNVSAGDEVIVTVYAYNAWNADGLDLAGMWAKANYSSNITITGSAWAGLGADPGAGSLVTTSYSSGTDYIPYSTSQPVQIYKVDDLDNGEWYQWGFRFTVLSGHIQSNYTLWVLSYLGQFVNKQFLITFT